MRKIICISFLEKQKNENHIFTKKTGRFKFRTDFEYHIGFAKQMRF